MANLLDSFVDGRSRVSNSVARTATSAPWPFSPRLSRRSARSSLEHRAACRGRIEHVRPKPRRGASKCTKPAVLRAARGESEALSCRSPRPRRPCLPTPPYRRPQRTSARIWRIFESRRRSPRLSYCAATIAGNPERLRTPIPLARSGRASGRHPNTLQYALRSYE